MFYNKTTTVYLLRHGQTEHNVLRIIQGQHDSALTREGIDATKERAIMLKDVVFDSVFCSDLDRARKSLEFILAELDCNIDVNYCEEIREIDFGKFTGGNIDELKDTILDYKSHKSKSYPGGESGDSFNNRVINFVEDVRNRYEGKTLLFMSHFGVIETILKHYIKDLDGKLNTRNLDNKLNTRNYDIGILYFNNEGVKFKWI